MSKNCGWKGIKRYGDVCRFYFGDGELQEVTDALVTVRSDKISIRDICNRWGADRRSTLSGALLEVEYPSERILAVPKNRKL